MKRVVVTGIGAISPLADSFIRSWDALKAGRAGIGPITRFDASHLPWNVAGEMKGFDVKAYLSEREMKRLDPFVHFAVAASTMAVKNAGLIPDTSRVTRYASPPLHPPRGKGGQWGGVIIGSSRGGISTVEKSLLKKQNSKLETKNSELRKPFLRLSPYLMPATTIGMAASYAAQKLGIKGYCLGISNACASGTNAIGEAFRLIKSGYLRLIVVGGSEAPICRVCVEGYGISGALSRHGSHSETAQKVPRPFDKYRDGFVLSEGACILVLEEYDHAVKRGADIYGEIIGYGNTTDAFHMTRPDPEGEANAMIMAIKEAGISPAEVDYINTHGTGTEIGDIAEVKAIKMVLGKRASTIPATAIKSMTGHMLAASGAFEIASTLMTMKEDIIPPTINLDEKDPECDIDIITKKKKAEIKIAISNSFGFGGVNAVIVLRRLE